MPIHSLLLRALLIRGTIIWLFARGVAAAVLATSPDASSGPLVLLWVLGFSATLTWVDLRRRKELMLFRNLGLSPVSVIVIALSAGTLVELACILA